MASGVQAIIDLRDQLARRDGSRNDSYDQVLRFLTGTTLKEAQSQGHFSGIENAMQYIFQSKTGDEDDEFSTPINIVKPAVENKVAFLSLPFTTRVIEPPDSKAPGAALPSQEGAEVAPEQPDEMDEMFSEPETTPIPPPSAAVPPPGQPSRPSKDIDKDWGTNLADREEKVIQSLLNASNMPKRMRDVAWSMCAMDGAVLGVWPDFRHGRPRIITMTPQDFYPVSYDPDGLELSKAVWVSEMNGYDIEAQYGSKKYIGQDRIKVTKCIDEEKFYTILDDKEWAHPPVENKLGFVPLVCIGSLGLPGMIFGSTDIKDALPVARWMNYHAFLMDKMSNAMIEPTIFISDPLNVPPDLAIGKGGVATGGPGAKVELLGPIDLPQAFWQFGATLQNWFDIIADNPAVLRSDAGSGWVTAKGFNAQMGPIAARMQVRLDIALAGWRQVIKYMLMMWADFPGVNKKQSLSGFDDGEYYYIEATPEEFMVDGKIWTEVDCFLQAQSYMDRQGTAIELIQLYQNEMVSWQTVLDNLPYVVDRKRERERIDKDREWKAKGMAMAQQVSQSPATANPDLGAQERTNFGLERGFLGEVPPPAGPTASGGAPSGGALQEPEEDIVSLLQEFFSGIQKLRGPVWFGGDPVTSPDKLSGDDWTVTVWIVDSQDRGTITRAAEKVEEIYGHLTFVQGEPAPDEQAIQVNGGEELAPEAEPPELTGMPPGVGLGGME